MPNAVTHVLLTIIVIDLFRNYFAKHNLCSEKDLNLYAGGEI